MKIENAKDLAKLIALCRKTGVQSIRVDNIEFHLGDMPDNTTSAKRQLPKVGNQLPKSGNSGPDVIESDELTEEQLLLWSVTGSPDANAADTN